MLFRRRTRTAESRPEAAAAVDLLRPDEIAFLLCVEANRLEPQARLLCESIRRFGGRYRESTIIAVSPRPELALAPEAVAELQALDVTYVALPLNETGSAYGTINRIVSGAWAEATLDHPYLVVLDTDTIVVAEPSFVRHDVGVRPVDVKGSASAGPQDPLDVYWARVCEFAGIDLDRLPTLTTSISGERIRASYNGGFTVVRRDRRILTATHDIFFRTFAEQLRPLQGRGDNVQASTGQVGIEASEWWGSSQAALAAAIWANTDDVHLYDAACNIPLHCLAENGGEWPHLPEGPVLLHYHYLAEPEYRAQLHTVLAGLGCSDEVQQWIDERLTWFDEAPARHADVCWCTLAIHAPYRERARVLCSDVPTMPWVVLTDEPDDFADLAATMDLRAVAHEPTGPMAIDYVERLQPTGNNRGAAAYHDKRFALQHALAQHDTAIFLDADSRVGTLPSLPAFPGGISVLPVVDRSIAEHLAVAGSWRLPAFEALAEHLTGSRAVLDIARWCHESCVAITKDGNEAIFFETWGRAAEFLQAREVYSGEGGVIGLAAAAAGWIVDLEAVTPIGDAVQHEGGGPKAD